MGLPGSGAYMPFDEYRDIANADEVRTRAELVHAFNNTAADRVTGRNDVSQTGGKIENAEMKRKKTARQFLADLQRIIEDGKLAAEIIDRIIASKSDVQIADMVAQIEDETGLILQEYAAGILGARDALRRPNESDADYNRRIISAVAAEIIDPATGRIKKQFKDDPLAQIILSDQAYRDLMAQVELINRNDANADSLVQKFATAGYESAELAGHQVEANDAKDDLRQGQDVGRDLVGLTDRSVQRNAGFFQVPGSSSG